MPGLEALQDRFAKAHCQTLGVSVDSVYCHANWGKSIGGVSFPLLADFHPKGAVAESYGVYLAANGITDRATVVIDADGVVQFAESVTPGGKRDIATLAAKVEEIHKSYGKSLPEQATPGSLSADSTLYVKNSCGFSRAVLLARDNLHLQDSLPVVNVSDDPSALAALKKKSGSEQAPCLVEGDKAMLESKDIVSRLVEGTRPL